MYLINVWYLQGSTSHAPAVQQLNSFVLLLAKRTWINTDTTGEVKDELDRYLMDSYQRSSELVNNELESLSSCSKAASNPCSLNTWCTFVLDFSVSFSGMCCSRYLTASSVGVEHAFSHGHILISHLHNRLRAETICTLMCFGDWSCQDYISNEELVWLLLSDANNDREDMEFIDNDIL